MVFVCLFSDVDFNTTCGHAMKKRCKTKQSSCIENTCVCATGKMYATELDSCKESKTRMYIHF